MYPNDVNSVLIYQDIVYKSNKIVEKKLEHSYFVIFCIIGHRYKEHLKRQLHDISYGINPTETDSVHKSSAMFSDPETSTFT